MAARKNKNKVSKQGAVWKQTSEEATLAKMPKFNGYACGTGAHGDRKYDRKKEERRRNKLDSL